MNRVVLNHRVGADGVLNVSVPLLPEDANKTVRVIVEPAEEASRAYAPPMTQEEWLKFIESTAGVITDPTFERASQGEFEQRDPLQ